MKFHDVEKFAVFDRSSDLAAPAGERQSRHLHCPVSVRQRVPLRENSL